MKTNIPLKNKLFVIVYILLGMLFSINKAVAQKEVEKVKNYLQANAARYHLSTNDIQEMSISSAYLSPTTGWYHIYYNQVYQSIEVYNGVLNAALVNDKVEHISNNFVKDLEAKIPAGISTLQLSPLIAISKATTHLGLSYNPSDTKEEAVIRLANGQVSKAVYTNTTLTNETIPVKIYWFPHTISDSSGTTTKLHLVWNVGIASKDHKNHWIAQVDAHSGEVLNVDDQVIKCTFGRHEQATPQHNHWQNTLSDTNTATDSRLTSLAPNSYNVFAYPVESPIHGSRSIVSNPYTKYTPAGTGPGTTNGWHDDGSTSYTTTRGNNVDAKEDIAADDETTIGTSPTSATLEFDFNYAHGNSNAAYNRDAAITNVFYWNNLIHDVLWRYGFDEPSGNFQKDNMGRGGLGNDYVLADVQDGLGTDNAYFGTPIDGGNGRMQMLLWANGDSDFDNAIISHEYGHGWSTRLTGGPAVNHCLSNAEQAGEGWSDYLALMLTTRWDTLTPSVASANIKRGLGQYSLGQTTSGGGFRLYPYSYDMAHVNSAVTYSLISTYKGSHAIGSFWTTMLWDMTWEIIFRDNQIVNDIYTTTTMVGNVAALKLVNEGLRLQKCNPSFVDARDAILKADSLLFNSRYRCAIWKAFARRGLGVNASTGETSNDYVVIQDFTFPTWVMSSPTTAIVCSRTVFNYTAVIAGLKTFSWSRAAVVGISNPAANGNSATINETLVNMTSNPIVVTYTINLPFGSCQAPFQVNVTVNPSSDKLNVTDYTICQNGTIPNGEGLSVIPHQTNSLSGSIVGGPTYWRSKGNNATTYATAPIGIGNDVYYQIHTFTPATSGVATIEVVAAAFNLGFPYDTYLSLYQTSFNPASPAINFVAGDDDSGTLQYSSKITYNFIAGTTYVLVVAPYYNGSTGTYQLQASANIFGSKRNWYDAPVGGNVLSTSDIFNPVGVAGSGISDMATPIQKTFYMGNEEYACRFPAVFTIQPPAGGTITGGGTICTNNNTGLLSYSGSTAIARWESSIDNFATNTSIANTTNTLAYNNLTQTTQYRVILQSPICGAITTAPVTISKAEATLPIVADYSLCRFGTVPAGQGLTVIPVNMDNSSGVLTTSSPTYWRSGSSNSTYTPVSVSIGGSVYYQTHTFNSPTTISVSFETVEVAFTGEYPHDTYMALYKDSFNPTSPATNFVMGNDDGGTLKFSSKITYTLTAGTTYILVISPYNNGKTGTYKIKSSLNSLVNPSKWYTTSLGGTPISSAAFFNPVGVAGSGIPNSATSLSKSFFVEVPGFTTCRVPATLTINAPPIAGTLPFPYHASFCFNATSTLTLNGGTGNVLRWESTTDNFATITQIPETSKTLSYTNLQETTYFRAVVGMPGCSPVNSNMTIVAKVANIPTTTNYAICQDIAVPNGQGLVATAPVYSKYVTGFVNFNSPTYCRSIGDNTSVYTPAAIGFNNTYYQTHTFTPATSGPVTIEGIAGTLTIHPFDTYMSLYETSFDPASPATNFLKGDDNSGAIPYAPKLTYNVTAGTTYVLVITPYQDGRGGSYQLKASSNIFYHENTWYEGVLPLATGNTFNPVGVAGSGILNTSTPLTKAYYVGSSGLGNCRVRAVFTINQGSAGGSIDGNTVACSAINTGILTLSGYTGTILRWEASTDNFATNTPIANATPTLSYNNLLQTMQYRAIVKQGECEAANSAIATVTKMDITSPTLTGSTRCSPGTSILTATGCTGGTVNWYAGISGGTAIATGTSFTTPTISSTTTYYADCIISACISERIPAIAAIGTTEAIYSTSQTAGTFQVSQTITSSANVATGVNYFAGKAIVLSPGFQAGGSEVFSASIRDCQ